MLTSFLPDVCEAGETAAEFIALFQKLTSGNHWKYYLTVSKRGRFAVLETR